MKNKLFHNEKGLTLAELLATFAIASFVLVFVTGIIITVQKQYVSQKEGISELTDVKIALKSITRDLRKAEEVRDINNNSITIVFDVDKDDKVTYKFQGNSLYKGESVYIYNVSGFEVTQDEENENKITLKITSGNQEEETTIVLRE